MDACSNKCLKKLCSKCVTCPDVLKFLGNFTGIPVKLLGNALLLRWVERVELFAEITINYIFDWKVGRSE